MKREKERKATSQLANKFGRRERRGHRVVAGATLQILAFAKMAAPNECGFFLKNVVFFLKDGSK